MPSGSPTRFDVISQKVRRIGPQAAWMGRTDDSRYAVAADDPPEIEMTDNDQTNEPTPAIAPIEPAPRTVNIETDAVAFHESVRQTTGRSVAVRAGMLAGSAVLIVLGAVAVMGASPSPATGADPSATTPAANETAAPDASNAPGPDRPGLKGFPWSGPQGGPGFRGGAFGGIGFGGITVTTVVGSNVELKTDDGWTRTITVTGTTKITKGGATIAVGDLAVGDKVRFGQERAADGTYSITAIVVVLPSVAGQVSAVGGDTITVTLPGGTTATIHVDGSTTYTVDGAKGSLSDVKVGAFVVAEGTQRSDGSLDAAQVRIGTKGRGLGGPGFPGMPGFRGFPGHDDPNDPDASPAPSSGAS